MRSAFHANPPIKTYQCNAYALGAVMPLGEKVAGILDNNYIAWQFHSKFDESVLPLIFLPHISPPTFNRCGLGPQLSFQATNRDDLCFAIVGSLKRGFFVRLLVDEYHIPNRWTYGTRHRIHDVLVLEASHDESSFTLMGYCSDRRYRESICSLDALSKGYFEAAPKAGKTGFVAFKAEPTQPIGIAPALIKQQLEFFLQSRFPNERTSAEGTSFGNTTSGLSVFDSSEEYVRGLRPTDPQDRRIFSIIAEHSFLMLRRTATVGKQLGVVIDETAAASAKDAAGSLKLLSLLPHHRRSEESLGEMARLIKVIKEEMKKAMEILGEAIDRHN